MKGEKTINKTLNIFGSAIGYSAIEMALVNKNIHVTTIERDEVRYLEAINIINSKLGKEIIIKDNEVVLKGELTKQECVEFEVLESGSTLRFLIPVAMVFSSNIKINCSPRLIKRGIGVYVDAFSSKGIDIKVNETSIEIKGELTGNISSQYVTGLLFALSLLDKTSYLKVLKPVESEDYINITLDVLKQKYPSIDTNLNSDVYFISSQEKIESVNNLCHVSFDHCHAFCFSCYRYIKKALCHCTCDCRNGIRISAKRNCISYNIFI